MRQVSGTFAVKGSGLEHRNAGTNVVHLLGVPAFLKDNRKFK